MKLLSRLWPLVVGGFLGLTAAAGAADVTVEVGIDTPGDTLWAGVPAVITISIASSVQVTGFQIPLKITSAGGATWTLTSQTSGWGTSKYVTHVPGSRIDPPATLFNLVPGLYVKETLVPDSIFFTAVAFTSAGMPPGPMQHVLSIHFTPQSVPDNGGETICVDTYLDAQLGGLLFITTGGGGVSVDINTPICLPVVGCGDYDADGLCYDEDNCDNDFNPGQEDTDGDGIGDACDEDDDNDGVFDFADANPLDPTVCVDDDADGCDDCAIGYDGFGPLADYSPINDGPDTDADGLCDAGDADDDNDGVLDFADTNPLNPTVCVDDDADGCDDCAIGYDGFGPLADYSPINDGPDTDADGVCDAGDNCLNDPNPGQEDTDGDHIGDACDYICGDANGDVTINVGDAVHVINYVFKSGPEPDPIDAGDANCDGTINVGDAVHVINYVFKGGDAPCCP